MNIATKQNTVQNTKLTLGFTPLNLSEIAKTINYRDNPHWIELFLNYGLIPEIYKSLLHMKNTKNHLKIVLEFLKEIINNEVITNPITFTKLIKYYAHNIGNAIHFSSLASSFGLNIRTIIRYTQILEKYNIIFPIYGYHKSLPDEVHKFPKYFFCDQSYLTYFFNTKNNLSSSKISQKLLWYNFCVNEKHKEIKSFEKKDKILLYYWQNYHKQCVDLVIWNKHRRRTDIFNFDYSGTYNVIMETNAKINTGLDPLFEIKSPKIWQKNYPKVKMFEVNSNNIRSFVKL